MNKKRKTEIAQGMSEIHRIAEEYNIGVWPVDDDDHTWFVVQAEDTLDTVHIFNEYFSMKESNEPTN